MSDSSDMQGPETAARIEQARAAMQAAQPRDRATRLRYNHEELVGQPAAIRETLLAERESIRAVAALLAGRCQGRIYGIGCGDSWASCVAVAALFESLLNVPFEAVQALEFARFGSRFVGEEDVVIGLSASGTTAETLRGLSLARAAGALTIGVTNNADSPFARVPDAYLRGHALRRASFPTQASTVGVALLLALACETARLRAVQPNDVAMVEGWLDGLPALVEQLVSTAEPLAEAIGAQLVNNTVFTFVGAGSGMAAAMYGAAKIREGCEGYGWVIGTEEFHHYEIAHAGEPVFLVAPDDPAYPRAVDVAREVERAGGLLYSIVPEGEEEIASRSAFAFHVPPVPPALVALPYAIPLQLAAWHIAHAKLKGGLLS